MFVARFLGILQAKSYHRCLTELFKNAKGDIFWKTAYNSREYELWTPINRHL